jgi:hypothetical protein
MNANSDGSAFRGLGGSNTTPPNDRHSADTRPVMPAKAGIHDLPSCKQSKSWIPAFSGMAGLTQRGWVNLYVGWYSLTVSRVRHFLPGGPHIVLASIQPRRKTLAGAAIDQEFHTWATTTSSSRSLATTAWA